jgi:hypothetical protein
MVSYQGLISPPKPPLQPPFPWLVSTCSHAHLLFVASRRIDLSKA